MIDSAKNKAIKNWLLMVDYDLRTAQYMFKSGRYVYVVFMCHLSIEKVMKAIVTSEIDKIPPKIHDLLQLVQLGKIEIPAEYLEFISKINQLNVVTRYPEDFLSLKKTYSRKSTREVLDKTIKVIQCLRKDKRLRK